MASKEKSQWNDTGTICLRHQPGNLIKITKPLAEISAQYQDRNTAIIAAYKTGTYSQREIGDFYQLHPTSGSGNAASVGF